MAHHASLQRIIVVLATRNTNVPSCSITAPNVLEPAANERPLMLVTGGSQQRAAKCLS